MKIKIKLDEKNKTMKVKFNKSKYRREAIICSLAAVIAKQLCYIKDDTIRHSLKRAVIAAIETLPDSPGHGESDTSYHA